MLLFIFLIPVIWIPGKWWKKSLSFIAFVFLWTLSFETVYKKKFEKKTAECAKAVLNIFFLPNK